MAVSLKQTPAEMPSLHKKTVAQNTRAQQNTQQIHQHSPCSQARLVAVLVRQRTPLIVIIVIAITHSATLLHVRFVRLVRGSLDRADESADRIHQNAVKDRA
jgi:hypothetical protein